MILESHLARALAVLAEALVSERRVMIVGDSSLRLHELVHDLGARLVHVYDPDGARAMRQTPPTARGTVLRGLPEGDFDVRDGAFDLAIVPDLSVVPDAAALLARVRRVVGEEGAVMCAASNRDAEGATGSGAKGLDYYELYDLVSLQFESVRMIAAMPFYGVTMAELGQDEVESAVRVDTQLAGERSSPSAFVALASQSDVALDAYAVIELEVAQGNAAPEGVARATEAEAQLAEARLRTSVLEAQVEGLAQARVVQARAEEDARRALEALEDERARASRLERELDAARRVAEPPKAEGAHSEDASDLAEQLAEAQIRAAALEEGVDLAERTIVSQRDRIADLEAAIAHAEETAMAAAAVVAPPVPLRVEPLEDEVASLETKLHDRGERVKELEAELARREKLVKELVARLATGGAPAIDEDLHKKLDELAILAAKQRSELEARAWRIAELERKVGHELAGEGELEDARAELQKQAVLIEQLKTIGA